MLSTVSQVSHHAWLTPRVKERPDRTLGEHVRALEPLITKAITLCTAKQLPHDFMRAVLIYECNQLQPSAPQDVGVSTPLCPMMMDCLFNGVIVALVAVQGVIHW